MGTDKRARQKAGRAARVEAAREAQRKAASRSRLVRVLGVVAIAVVLIGAFLYVRNRRDGSNEQALDASGSTTTTLAISTTTLASAAGKPCVAATNVPAAEGKPTVSVPEGPPPTELLIEDLKVGEGDAVPAGATVTVHYVGISCSTGEQFDSSWDRGQPATFPLDQVIPGWTQGIVGMQVGGQRQLVIPPDLAYGSAGRPGIAPDETLIFVVDLVSIGDTTSTTSASPASSTTTTTTSPTTTAAP